MSGINQQCYRTVCLDHCVCGLEFRLVHAVFRNKNPSILLLDHCGERTIFIWYLVFECACSSFHSGGTK